jgi:hypothetical protein
MLVIAVVGISVCLAGTAFAAGAASDDASDSTYDTGWSNGDNGGSGWGAGWVLSTSGANAGFFVNTSTNNGNDGTAGQDGNSDDDINTAGRAWGLWANSGDTANAVRQFDGALAVGDVLELSMDNGWNDGTVGWGLQNASGENLIEWFHVGGNGTYSIFDQTTSHDSNLGWSAEGLEFIFELTSGSTWEMTVTRLESSTVITTNGVLANPAGGQDAAQIRFFNANAGTGQEYDYFVNSLNITPIPEPATFGFLSLGASMLFILRRRRRV